MAQFDPWDWLGVPSGGFSRYIDGDIIEVLLNLQNGETDVGVNIVGFSYAELICYFLCNTDSFDFGGCPTDLKFIGDDSFRTLDDLIDAWKDYYRRRWGEDYE